ncbi:MAG: hypothetical protein AAFQ94_29570, partial [Bacteroidota bacterium]
MNFLSNSHTFDNLLLFFVQIYSISYVSRFHFFSAIYQKYESSIENSLNKRVDFFRELRIF